MEKKGILVQLFLCFLFVHGYHAQYFANPYAGYGVGAAGASQQQQKSAESESYQKAKSNSQSSSGAGYGQGGYPGPVTPFAYTAPYSVGSPPHFGYAGGAAGASQQQQKSAESESYKKAKSNSQSSSGAGYGQSGYPGPVAPFAYTAPYAVGYPAIAPHFGYGGGAAGASQQQQKSDESESYQKAKSNSQSSSGAGYGQGGYPGPVAPHFAYPPPYGPKAGAAANAGNKPAQETYTMNEKRREPRYRPY